MKNNFRSTLVVWYLNGNIESLLKKRQYEFITVGVKKIVHLEKVTVESTLVGSKKKAKRYIDV